jgi:TolB protein
MNSDGSKQRQLTRGGAHPLWSPDGRTLAYDGSGRSVCPPDVFRCGNTVAVRTVRVDGSANRILEEASRNPSWSPSGRRIAYEADIDPYGDAHGIRVANADGRNARWLVRGSAESPAWSPNGRLIAYMAGQRIYVVRPNGTGRRRIADGRLPIWAPARGARLAYLCRLRKRSQAFALCIVKADGRARRVVAQGILRAAWSPRGARLAYVRSNGIFVVKADGRGRTRVARTEQGVSIRSLAWSASGRRLVFSEEREYNDLELFAAAADGSSAKPLTRNAVNDQQPSWSPDGRRLTFVRSTRKGGVDIWLMDASGREQRLLVRNGFDPSWTPDGKRIVFSRYVGAGTTPYSMYSVSVSGGDERLLVADCVHGAPAPDGTKLAFLRFSTLPEQLFIATADGNAATPLTPAATTDSLSWSPDSATLAFGGNSLAGQGEAVYTIRVDGSRLTRVVPNAHSPSFSPDATGLAFTTQGPLGSQIEAIGLEGSSRWVVAAARGQNVDPDWQPLPR